MVSIGGMYLCDYVCEVCVHAGYVRVLRPGVARPSVARPGVARPGVAT